MEIKFINDKLCYIDRYRAGLLDYALKLNYGVEKYSSLTKLVVESRRSKGDTKTVVVSSNLRTNLKVLLFYWSPIIIILNGLGRYRKTKLRFIIGYLIGLRIDSSFLIQNYADFRYFRRFFNHNVIWMPGSGGSRRNSKKIGYFVITRDEKFDLIKKSIDNFMTVHQVTNVNILGLRDKQVDKRRYVDVGYVAQHEIFCFGSDLIVPSGYGEGIPHVLVDAFCSDVTVWLQKHSFRQYGLYKLDLKVTESGGWVRIDPRCSRSKLKLFSACNVNELVFDLIRDKWN